MGRPLAPGVPPPVEGLEAEYEVMEVMEE